MSVIKIETNQNVLIEYEAANVGERIASQLIDYVIISSYIIFFSLIFSRMSNNSDSNIGLFIFLLPVLFYSLLCETFLEGQSFGKKILQIKVLKIDGSSAGFGNYLVRWMFRLIDVHFFYGIVAIITISVNAKGQRLGDIVAKTSVISLKRTKKIEDTIFQKLPEEYKPVFLQSDLLSEDDIRTINDVIIYYRKNVHNEKAITLLKQTIEAVKRKTGIQSDKNPLYILETIIKDYNALHKNS